MSYQVLGVCLLLLFVNAGSVSGQESAHDLVKVIEDPDKTPATKLKALVSLQKLGPEAEPAVPLLTKMVADTKAQEDREFLTLANYSLRCLKHVGKPGIPGLRTGLQSKHLRLQAAIWLGEFGPDARDAAPQMLACIAADPRVCFGMFEDLDKIGPDPKDLVPVAIKVLKYYADPAEKAPYRAAPARLACNSLAKVGPSAKEAVPALIDVLKFHGLGAELATTKSAMAALGAIGRDAAEALPVLRTFLTKPPQDVAQAAGEAITKIK
jgi:hypothetical protein